MRALQIPIKDTVLLTVVFPLLGFTQHPQTLSCPAETTPLCYCDVKYTFLASAPSQTAMKDCCSSGILPTTGHTAPHHILSHVLPMQPQAGNQSLLELTALCSAEMEQNAGGTPGFLFFAHLDPDGSSPSSFQTLTLLRTDWMKSPIISLVFIEALGS